MSAIRVVFERRAKRRLNLLGATRQTPRLISWRRRPKRDAESREVKSPINPDFRSFEVGATFHLVLRRRNRASGALSFQASKATADANLEATTQFALRRLKTLEPRDADSAALGNALSTVARTIRAPRSRVPLLIDSKNASSADSAKSPDSSPPNLRSRFA